MTKYYASVLRPSKVIVDGVDLSQNIFMIDTEKKIVGCYLYDKKGKTILNELGNDVVRVELEFIKLRLISKNDTIPTIEIGYEIEDSKINEELKT